MAKHRRSRYEAGRRSTAWLKLKVRPTQELVVGGYVPGQGSHRDLGALVVGVMDEGRLRYAGRVGSGLDTATRARLRAALDARSRRSTRSTTRPRTWPARPGRRWATPDARDPGRDRRLVAGRDRPPGDVRPGGARGRSGLGRAPGGGRAGGGRAGAREGRRRAARPRRRAHPVSKPNGSRCRRMSGRAADTRRSIRSPIPPGAVVEPPTAEELAALDALPGRGGTWRIGGRDVALTNLDKVLAPGPPGGRAAARRCAAAAGAAARRGDGRRPAGDQARPRPLLRAGRPGHAPPPRRPGAQPRPLPGRGRRRLLLAEGRGEGNARLGDPLARARPAGPAAARLRRGRRRSRRWPGSATRPPSSSTRGPRRSTRRPSRAGRSSTSTRARARPGRRRSSSPGSTGARSTTSASSASRR